MLRPRQCRSCFRDKCSQLISACLPESGCQTWTRTKTSGLTNRRATLTPSGNRMDPWRCRQDSHLHESVYKTDAWINSATAANIHVARFRSYAVRGPQYENWSARQELHLRSSGSRPEMLLLHHTLFAPARFKSSGRARDCGGQNPGNGPAGKINEIGNETGASDGTCTHTLPADNGWL
jgi:hypothetical protein